MPTTTNVSIIPTTRRSARHPPGQERQADEASFMDDTESTMSNATRRRKRTQKDWVDFDADDNNPFPKTDIEKMRAEMLAQLEYNYIKELWNSNKIEDRIEVGRLEVLLYGAYNSYTQQKTNAIIQKFGGLPYSIAEYDSLNNMDLNAEKKKKKNILSKILPRFKKLRDEVINDNGKRIEFIIRDDKWLLEWICLYQMVNEGIDLIPKKMMINGLLTPESAAIIRHILYTHPKIGWCDFNWLLAEVAVLLLGRPLKAEEMASLATIRSNIARLDALDQIELKRQYEKFLTRKSPCGNDVFFGGASDATKHGRQNVRNVFMTVFDMGPTEEQERLAKDDPLGWEQYKLNLALHVASAGKSADYAQSNIDALTEFVPKDLLYRYKIHALDNCFGAVEEGRDTTKAATQRTEPLDESKTHIYGVEIVGKAVRDPFHIFQLQCKYFSEAVMGKTEKGNHNMKHHRMVSLLCICVYLC